MLILDNKNDVIQTIVQHMQKKHGIEVCYSLKNMDFDGDAKIGMNIFPVKKKKYSFAEAAKNVLNVESKTKKTDDKFTCHGRRKNR